MNTRDIPTWAIDLVAALEDHEDVHPAENPHWCVKEILDAIPVDVRSFVSAWKAGYDAAKNERAQGGIIARPVPTLREPGEPLIVVRKARE